MSALTVRGVRKSYGDVPVLRGIDLQVPAQSFTALLGPSGCGKTTLLRLIAGFADPDAGTICFDDEPVFAPGRCTPAEKRRVGYVPQEGALFPHLSAAANVLFGLPRRERRRSRSAELLDMVGLTPALADRYPHELSGGQQQRVALARALAPQPSLVLLDEPFSSLDAGLRESTRQAVLEVLRDAKTTTLLVTHDQGEALSMADEVAVMRDGILMQHAPPQQLYRSPADLDVALFVGGAVLVPGFVSDGVATCELGALAVTPTALRGPVQLLIRPEQIRLHPGAGSSRVAARVRTLSYFGHDSAVLLELLPTGCEVVARVLGARSPRPGDTVWLTVDGTVAAYPPRPALT